MMRTKSRCECGFAFKGRMVLHGVMVFMAWVLWGGVSAYAAILPCERVGLDVVIARAVDQDELLLSGTTNVIRPNIKNVTNEELRYCLQHHRACLLLIKPDYRAWFGRDDDSDANLPWPKQKQAIPFVVMQYDKGEVNGHHLSQGVCAVLHQNLGNPNQWDVSLWQVDNQPITEEKLVIQQPESVGQLMKAAKEMMFKLNKASVPEEATSSR